ncbi:hypothetical protein ONZ45_g5678 [Pleurotus djamor]|nr:hypothetical protein ONZ45_g5678 [Pleurotus djamor]
MTKNSLSDVAPLDRSNPQGVCSTSASGPSVTTKDLGPTALKIGDNASALGGAKTECSNCGATQTPLWRKGLNDELNCNACGLYYKLHKHPRPKNMWSRSNHRHAQAAPGGRGRSISPSRPSKHTQVRVGPEAECYNCHTTSTPLWRKDGEGETVCNACGLFYKLHGVARPLSMRSNVVRKRSSHATEGLSNDSSELPPKIIHRALGFTKQPFTTDVNLPALHTERHPTIINLSGLEIPATKPIDDQADEQEKISKLSIHDVHVFNDPEHGVLEVPSILATPFDTEAASPIDEELGEDLALHDPSPQTACETALKRALLGARDLTLRGVTSTFYESKPKHNSRNFRRRKTTIIINAQENCGNIVRMINSHNDSSRYEVNSGDVFNNNYGDGTFTNAHTLNNNLPPNNASEDNANDEFRPPQASAEQPTHPTTDLPYLTQWVIYVWSWVPCLSWNGLFSGWIAQLTPQACSQWVWPH